MGPALTMLVRKGADGDSLDDTLFEVTFPEGYKPVTDEYLEFLTRSVELLTNNPLYVIRVEVERPEKKSFEDELIVKMRAIPYQTNHLTLPARTDDETEVYFEASTQWKDSGVDFLTNFFRNQSRAIAQIAFERKIETMDDAKQKRLRADNAVDPHYCTSWARDFRYSHNAGSLLVMHNPRTLPEYLRCMVFGFETQIRELFQRHPEYGVRFEIRELNDVSGGGEHKYMVSYYLTRPEELRIDPNPIDILIGTQCVRLAVPHFRGAKPIYTEMYDKSEFTRAEVERRSQLKIDYLLHSIQNK